MESTERELIMGVWGCAPISRVQAKPLVRVKEADEILAIKAVSLH